jgi:hypothetical protein
MFDPNIDVFATFDNARTSRAAADGIFQRRPGQPTKSWANIGKEKRRRLNAIKQNPIKQDIMQFRNAIKHFSESYKSECGKTESNEATAQGRKKILSVTFRERLG